MKLLRLIAPDWLLAKSVSIKRVQEGLFDDAEISRLNTQGYNVYYYPNYPTSYYYGQPIVGADIEVFEYVFVDCDLKDKAYLNKDAFIETLVESGITPTKIVDSGHGVHAYWRVQGLDSMSYLRLQRRLIRKFNTDEAVGQIFQLMRLPGTINTKDPTNLLPCNTLYESDYVYTAEELDKVLPIIQERDEQYCKQHYAKTYNLNQNQVLISDALPPKFGRFIRDNKEAKELFAGTSEDRSKSDYRLGHLMFSNGFTKEEALSVLVNSAKALQRAPVHRVSYAENIADKIWTYELTEDKEKLDLSLSVKEILQKTEGVLKGTRFPCHPRVDNTAHGFRLGQVIGLVAGSGVGKTAFALNLFRWFAESNPDYHHFFVPLEQPANEIADRWKTMSQGDESLHEKVHIMSNYDDEGGFRHLSFDEIREYIERFQKEKGLKIGCVVIDHIGALKKKGKLGENQDITDICHTMKAFAVQTNTLLVMQSQTNREKAGIGDLELNKDAAFGTVFFESYVDYLITMHQPLKRCHAEEGCPTVTAFKFCKIRHKKANKDIIKEDVCYYLRFDPDTELLRDMNQDEVTAFNYFLPKATNLRKQDRKTDLIKYQSVPYTAGEVEVAGTNINSNRHTTRH